LNFVDLKDVTPPSTEVISYVFDEEGVLSCLWRLFIGKRISLSSQAFCILKKLASFDKLKKKGKT
jgi:hypothetical protein